MEANSKNEIINIIGEGEKAYTLEVLNRILVAFTYYTIHSERAQDNKEEFDNVLYAIESLIRNVEKAEQ